MQMKHLKGKDQHVCRQPPPSSSISTMALTSGGGSLDRGVARSLEQGGGRPLKFRNFKSRAVAVFVHIHLAAT